MGGGGGGTGCATQTVIFVTDTCLTGKTALGGCRWARITKQRFIMAMGLVCCPWYLEGGADGVALIVVCVQRVHAEAERNYYDSQIIILDTLKQVLNSVRCLPSLFFSPSALPPSFWAPSVLFLFDLFGGSCPISFPVSLLFSFPISSCVLLGSIWLNTSWVELCLHRTGRFCKIMSVE